MSILTRRNFIPAAATLLAAAATSAFLIERNTAEAVSPAPVVSALANPAAPGDGLAERRITVARIARDIPALDAASARLVHRTSDRSIAVARRSDGQTCILIAGADGTGGFACNPDELVRLQGIAVTSPGLGYGVAPAGAAAVVFTLESGGSKTVQVDQNGFYTAPEDAVSGTPVGGSGAALAADSSIPFVPVSALPEGAHRDAYGNISGGSKR